MTSRGSRLYAPLTVLTLGLLALSSCGVALTEPDTTPADQATIESGEALYQAHCADCHGSDLRGTEKGPSHLSEVYVPSHHADGAFWLAVLRGVRQHHWRFGDMAPVDGLTQADVDAIVAFVRSVQDREGFEPYPP